MSFSDFACGETHSACVEHYYQRMVLPPQAGSMNQTETLPGAAIAQRFELEIKFTSKEMDEVKQTKSVSF